MLSEKFDMNHGRNDHGLVQKPRAQTYGRDLDMFRRNSQGLLYAQSKEQLIDTNASRN